MLRQLPLGLCACLLLVPIAAACGSNGDAQSETEGRTTAPTSPATTSVTVSGSGEEPALETPASRYSLLLADVGEGYFTDRQHTFVLGIDNYAATASFSSEDEGRELLEEWGYVQGFETAYEPEGRYTDVLNGKYYVAVETHLFESNAGAQQAYAYFENRIRSAGRAQVETAAVGNQHSAWKATGENVYGSSIPSAVHWVVLRRGNMVAIVKTYGAEPFMRVETARGLAAVLDEKALGRKDAPEPTPIAD